MAYYLVLTTGTTQRITTAELQYHQSVSRVLTDNTVARMMACLTFVNIMQHMELFLVMRSATIIAFPSVSNQQLSGNTLAQFPEISVK